MPRLKAQLCPLAEGPPAHAFPPLSLAVLLCKVGMIIETTLRSSVRSVTIWDVLGTLHGKPLLALLGPRSPLLTHDIQHTHDRTALQGQNPWGSHRHSLIVREWDRGAEYEQSKSTGLPTASKGSIHLILPVILRWALLLLPLCA